MGNGINELPEKTKLRQFGKFNLDPQKKILWRGEKAVSLPLKAVEILCVLTEHHGDLVTKDEILRSVWKATFVEESNLTNNISQLRKTFKSFGEENFIETIPRRGYRFVGEIADIVEREEVVFERRLVSRAYIEEFPEVHDKLPQLPRRATRRLGFMQLGFACAIAVILTAGLLTAWNWRSGGGNAANPDVRSIAVLPLKSFDSSDGNEQLRFQIMDALITKFGNAKGLLVRPTSAVIEFSKSDESSLEIGKKLQVDSILEGRIQQQGEQLRINFQLVSVKDGAQIWSEQFSGKAGQILDFQDVISTKLLTKLSLPLSPSQLKTFQKRTTENVDAYQEYLQGRYVSSSQSPSRKERLALARRSFEKAVELDPGFALAFASLSITVSMQSISEYIPRKEGRELAKMLAEKAYGLDPELAEANAALGFAMRDEPDQTVPEKFYLRAIELNPNYPNSYRWLFFVYTERGEIAKGIETLEAGIKLDPTNYSLVSEQVFAYQAADRCDKSLELLPEAIRLSGGNADGKNNVEAVTYSVCGLNELALPILERIWKEDTFENPSSSLLSQLGYSYAKIGNREKALEFAKMIEESNSLVYEKATPVYLALGEDKRVFRLLEAMTAKAPQRWSRLKYDLRLASLRDDARFIALNDRMTAKGN